MKTFNAKENLEIVAARCVGLLKALYIDPTRRPADTQEFFESEFVALYDQLQDLGFDNKSNLKWLFLGAMEKHDHVIIAKSVLGFTVNYKEMIIEVASPIESLYHGTLEMPSVIREKEESLLPIFNRGALPASHYVRVM